MTVVERLPRFLRDRHEPGGPDRCRGEALRQLAGEARTAHHDDLGVGDLLAVHLTHPLPRHRLEALGDGDRHARARDVFAHHRRERASPRRVRRQHGDLHVAGRRIELVRPAQLDVVRQVLGQQRVLPLLPHRGIGRQVVLVRPQGRGKAGARGVHRERCSHRAGPEDRHTRHAPTIAASRPSPPRRIRSAHHGGAAVPPGRRLRARREGEAAARRVRLLRRRRGGRADARREPAVVRSMAAPPAVPPRIGLPGPVHGAARHARRVPRPGGPVGVSGEGPSGRRARHRPRRGARRHDRRRVVDGGRRSRADRGGERRTEVVAAVSVRGRRTERGHARARGRGRLRGDLLDGGLPRRGTAPSRHAERVRDAVRHR